MLSESKQSRLTYPGLKILLGVYIVYLCFYGFNVLFTMNSPDIMALRNPATPMVVRIIDEILLGCLVLVTVSHRHLIRPNYKNIYLVSIASMVFAFYIAVEQIAKQGWLEEGYIRLAKNFISASAFLFVLVGIDNAGLMRWFLRLLNITITISLFVGVVHFVGWPNVAYGHRLIGAYANPNVTAFVSLFNIVLAYYLHTAEHTAARSTLVVIVVSSISLFCAGSLTAIIMLFAFILSFLIIAGWRVRNHVGLLAHDILTRANARLLIVSVIVGLVIGYTLEPRNLAEAYWQKVDDTIMAAGAVMRSGAVNQEYSVVSSGYSRVAMFMRSVDDFYHATVGVQMFGQIRHTYLQTDSTYVNIVANFGIIGLIFLVGVLLFPLAVYLRSSGMVRLVFSHPFGVLFLLTIVFNLSMQYSIEIVPTILFIYVAVFLLLNDLYRLKPLVK